MRDDVNQKLEESQRDIDRLTALLQDAEEINKFLRVKMASVETNFQQKVNEATEKAREDMQRDLREAKKAQEKAEALQKAEYDTQLDLLKNKCQKLEENTSKLLKEQQDKISEYYKRKWAEKEKELAQKWKAEGKSENVSRNSLSDANRAKSQPAQPAEDLAPYTPDNLLQTDVTIDPDEPIYKRHETEEAWTSVNWDVLRKLFLECGDAKSQMLSLESGSLQSFIERLFEYRRWHYPRMSVKQWSGLVKQITSLPEVTFKESITVANSVRLWSQKSNAKKETPLKGPPPKSETEDTRSVNRYTRSC